MHYSREFFIIRIFQRTVQYRAGPVPQQAVYLLNAIFIKTYCIFNANFSDSANLPET